MKLVIAAGITVLRRRTWLFASSSSNLGCRLFSGSLARCLGWCHVEC